MADISLTFAAENGISLDDVVGIFTGTTDPSVVGEAAPIGSLWIRQDGSLYQKVGPADTNWMEFSQGLSEAVKISATDSTAGYLGAKLLVSSYLTKTLQNTGFNENILLDLADTAITPGWYTKVNINQKGLAIDGQNPSTLSGYGIIDAQPLSTALTALAGSAYPGMYAVTGNGTSAVRTLTGTTNQIVVTNGDGSAGAPTFSLPSTGLTFPGSTGVFLPSGTTAQRIGDTGSTRFNTDTSSLEYFNGSVWVALVASTGGTVTSIAVTVPAGLTVSGSPITSSGTFAFGLESNLAAVQGLTTTGLAVRTGTDTWSTTTIQGTTARVAVTNGAGVAGTPTIDIDAAYAGQSSITTVGVINSGTWQGTTVSTQFGGTGRTSIGSANQLLTVNSTATGLEYKSLVASTGISVVASGGLIQVTNTGVTQIVGTANEVIVSPVTGLGVVTLSLPQAIATTSTPTFAQITVSSDPTSASQVATKHYVDNAIQGLSAKGAVVAASVGNLTLSGEQTVDGIALVTGDRVLVKNQTNAAQNGIYVVDTGAWTRATDLDTWTEAPAAFTFVEEGDTQQDTGWISTAIPGGTLETTAMPWVQFSAAGIVLAGTGLGKTGNTLYITDTGVTAGPGYNYFTVNAQGQVTTASTMPYLTANQTITLQGDVTGSGTTLINVDLTPTGITPGTYHALTVDADGRATGGTNPNTLDGYGITDAQPLNTYLTNLSGLSTDGIVVHSGGNALVRTIIAGSNLISVVNGDGLLGNPTIDLNTANIDINQIGGTPLGIANGGTDLTTLGSADQLLSVNSAGSGLEYRTVTGVGIMVTPSSGGLTLSTVNNGTVTSIDVQGSTGISTSGGPVTGAGVITLTLNSELQGLTTPTGLGLVTRTAAGTYVERSVVSALSTITVTNGAGNTGNISIDLSNVGTSGTYTKVVTDNFGRVVSGSSPTTLAGYGITDAQPLNAYLTSLSTNSGTGIVVKNGNSSFTRSIIAGSSKIVVTNGDGTTANPSIDLGIVNLEDLADVTVSTPSSGQALIWNGSSWVNGSVALKLYAENPVAQSTPTAQGNNSVAIGSGATSVSHDSIALGPQSLARLPGVTQASGRFATQGDAQTGTYILRTSTINGTPGVEFFFDGVNGSERLVMPSDSTWFWEASIVGHRTDADDHASFKIKGVVYCGASLNSIAMLGAPTKEILARSDSTWDVSVSADTTHGSLKITVQGATGKQIRWMALVQTVEITN